MGKKIICYVQRIIFLSFIFTKFALIKNSFAQSPNISPPSINVPKTPGTFGARNLDWNISDTGSVSWSIPFEFPATKQMQISLSLNYNPTSSLGEASHFWSLSIPKVQIDRKRGSTKYLTAQSCLSSTAENIYIDNVRMLSISPGVWASKGNSGQNILRCGSDNSFLYYYSDGTILQFGNTPESRIETPDGKATNWFLSRKSNFTGKGIIEYSYSKPIYKASDIKLHIMSNERVGFRNNINFISIPLLQSISSDDISAKIIYEKNNFMNPEFLQGFSQIAADRISSLHIQKGKFKIRSYLFEYEQSAISGRLISVKVLGTDDKFSYPKQVFKYSSFPFKNKENIGVKSEKFYTFYGAGLSKFGENSQLVDITGDGKPANIYTLGGRKLQNKFTIYETENMFESKNKNANIKIAFEGNIFFSDSVISWVNPNLINKPKWADIAGHGALDWIDISKNSALNPYFILNDFQRDNSGNVIMQRIAKLSRDDILFLRRAGCESSSDLHFVNFTDSGRADILCIYGGIGTLLVNEGLEPDKDVNALPGQYILKTSRIKLRQPFFGREGNIYDIEKDLRIVDWNDDGLPDVIMYSSSFGLTVYLNNGALAQKNYDGEFFTPVFLGGYGSLGHGKGIADIGIADLTGSGLPDLVVPTTTGPEIYINNGTGLPLTKVRLNSPYQIKTSGLQIVNFNGNGKSYLMAPGSGEADNYVIYDLDLPTFPNLLSSVLSEDGRLVSFQYSTPQKERLEAQNYDTNQDVKNLESLDPTKGQYLLPFVFPLVKQVSVSDGFNPTRITRYAYRVPTFDRTLAKFLDFGLVRKLNVGDATQAGQLFEYRFLSGLRYGLEDGNYDSQLSPVSFDPRLPSELQSLDAKYVSQCLISPKQEQNTNINEWCTNLAGYRYFSKTGAAQNGASAFTGEFLNTENNITHSQLIAPSFFNNIHLRSQGNIPLDKNELAQILTFSSSSTVTGTSYKGGFTTVTNTVLNSFDEMNRLESSIQVNDPARIGDNAITSYTYFCPNSHPENASTFCSLPQTITKTGQGYEAKMLSQYIYNPDNSLLLEINSLNQKGELKKQMWVEAYDEFARIVRFKKSSGEYIELNWSQSDAALNYTIDQDGVKTSAKYDEFGNLMQVQNTHGLINEFKYDALLRLTDKYKNKASDGKLIAAEAKTSNIFEKAYALMQSYFIKVTDSVSDTVNNATGNPTLVLTDHYSYQFPKITALANKNTIDIQNYMKDIEDSAIKIPDFPLPTDYTYQTAPALGNGVVTLGYVTAEHTNSAKEALTLTNKIWLSGSDEAVFEASRLDNFKFSLANKSARNSLGNIYKDFLNNTILPDDVLKNNLPNITTLTNANDSTFKLRSISSFFSDGTPKTIEFSDSQVMTYFRGADFSESISPEGRRNRSLYNTIGELITKQKGLDSQGNITTKTHILNMTYDAFNRLISLNDNDGLQATQHFAANGLIDSLINNRLGVARYFYDDSNRLTNSNLCALNINESNCLTATKNTILEKNIYYNEIGKIIKINSYRFQRDIGTNSEEIISYVYGSLKNISSIAEIGLPIETTVISKSEIGVSKSIRKLIHNEEGTSISEDLELFLGGSNHLISIGNYIVDREYDLSHNLVSLNTRGGMPREILNKVGKDNVTGYKAKYLVGTSTLENLAFAQNSVTSSQPLTGLNIDAEGYITNLHLENNLEMKATWHLRTQVPLALWVGDKTQLPADLINSSAINSPGLFHQRWEYDKDLYPISTLDASGQKTNTIFNGSSNFSYDELGRISQTKGNWGQIDYEYSPGGKIQKIVRNGLFISNRIAKGQNTLTDTYHYTGNNEKSQDGVLNSVSSSDGKVTANLNFKSDLLGFREWGVATTLAVLASGEQANSILSDHLNENTKKDGTLDNSIFVDTTPVATSWNNPSEIPMHKYVWSGRGLLQAVYGARQSDSKKSDIAVTELLTYRMLDEEGNLLAELDGVQLQKIVHATSENLNNNYFVNSTNPDEQNSIQITKLPRLVNFASGISFQRDEIHLNIGLGNFASLNLITRYPNLNAASPNTIQNVLQVRKELQVKDIVGSTSIVIDIDSKKIVERNTSEPFGLARGIPLLSNSVLNQYAAQGRRSDAQLYSNLQSNNRSNWEKQSFEVVGNNPDEMQGMRNSEVFALGKFSAQTGLNTMGVRSLDSARGVWISPDLYVGQNLDVMAQSPQQANLFQYAMNNPVTLNDGSGSFVQALIIVGVEFLETNAARIAMGWAYAHFTQNNTIQDATINENPNEVQNTASPVAIVNSAVPQITTAMEYGRRVQDCFHQNSNVPENQDSYTDKKGTTCKPDVWTSKGMIEIKTSRYLSNNSQMRCLAELCATEKLRSASFTCNLFVGNNTKLSEPLARNLEGVGMEATPDPSFNSFGKSDFSGKCEDFKMGKNIIERFKDFVDKKLGKDTSSSSQEKSSTGSKNNGKDISAEKNKINNTMDKKNI